MQIIFFVKKKKKSSTKIINYIHRVGPVSASPRSKVYPTRVVLISKIPSGEPILLVATAYRPPVESAELKKTNHNSMPNSLPYRAKPKVPVLSPAFKLR